MASGPEGGKGGAPALDDVKTERDAGAAARAKEAGAKDPAASVPSHSGDSPKPHGDKMERAVEEAARGPKKEG